MIKNILFVDDDLVALKMGELMLKSLGYKVFLAAGGEPCLKMLEKVEVDLIFLDLMMPDIYGIDVLRTIKANDELKNIPVIVQTGVRNDADLDKAYKLGAVGIISKPYSKADVKQMIHKVLLKENV